METFLKYYKTSAIFFVIAVVLGGLIGWLTGNTISAVVTAGFTVAMLSVLETSLSFDNAVLNATVLKNMSDSSRRWFMTWGVIFAVLGMRLITPVLIVSAIDVVTPWHAFMMALTDPKSYSAALTSSGLYVSAFGGSFLLMVALDFFLDSDRDEHWISFIEKPFQKLGAKGTFLVPITVILGSAIFMTHEKATDLGYYFSAGAGIALYLGIKFIKDKLESVTENKVASAIVNAGFWLTVANLAYLEILDASMSFDGVIGAFAVTTQIFLVMLGLGVGASFVRAMTIQLVDTDKMSEFRFLEHGAQYAILTLALMMFYKTHHELPEVVAGLTGAVLIGSAVIHSHILNKREAQPINAGLQSF
jgi:uncharacterized protein